MTDPTIPELIARLREIDCDNWTLCIGEAVGALHEDGDRLAEAVCELRKALPVILDALKRGPSRHAVDWHGTFRGTEADPRECGWCETCGREVYAGDGTHSPDAGKVVEGELYPDVRPWDLEPYYCRHVSAMTSEGLHSKADIAKQLAWRDKRIAHLQSLTTWSPIETAPRDGTEVALLFAHEETVTFGVLSTWPRVRAAFFTGSDWSIPYYANNPPIGWTPLPAPPAAEGGEGG